MKPCEICGVQSTYYGPNPYYSEIYDDHLPWYMCDECYDNACMDI